MEFEARKALLERQNQGLRELITEAEAGKLVPHDRFLVGLHESLVADIVRRQLPLQRPLGDRFVVTIESATIRFQDKFGVIVLDGKLHRPESPDRRTALRIHGGLGGIEIDPESHVLSMRVAIDRMELIEAGILQGVLGPGGRKFVADRGKDLLEDALPTFRVPVAVAHQLKVPAFNDPPVVLDSLHVPFDLDVERVIAVGGNLWITLDAQVGAVVGGEEGLGVSVKTKSKKKKAGRT